MIKKMAFIGAGSMAEAMISGILNKGLCKPEQIHVTNKQNTERLDELNVKYHVPATHDTESVIQSAEIVILAMKPKDVQTAIQEIRAFLNVNQLLVSIIAGVSSEFISHELGKAIPVVRAMPNTSATICLSATAIAPGTNATEEHLALAKRIFETIGTVTVVDEKDLHAVTGLSGSGPAYIYYLVEALEKAAIQSGLAQDVAKDLVKQTLIGAAEMIKVSTDSPATLRKKITSPGGTTQAGLEVLNEYKYQEGLIACVKRAAERSVELGDYFTVTSK